MKKVVTSQKDHRQDRIIPSSSEVDVEELQEAIPRLKKKLLHMQNELRLHLQSITEERRKTSPINYADPSDKSDADVAFGRNAKNEDTCKKKLQKIFEAIERIDEGEYGICEDCGDYINMKRLEVYPTTPWCIDCKTKKEQRDKAYGGGKWSQRHMWRS
jgi:DnaK suppressor protein